MFNRYEYGLSGLGKHPFFSPATLFARIVGDPINVLTNSVALWGDVIYWRVPPPGTDLHYIAQTTPRFAERFPYGYNVEPPDM